jgi:8-amino-7-oxononanoate synthase
MQRLTATLERLTRDNRLRALENTRGVDFTSNDYLGLRQHPALREAAMTALEKGIAIGSGGSRLLRGNDPAHAALEEQAADFFGSEAALFFANGFQANLAVMSTLPDRHDVVLFDALIHASLRDGIQANTAPHFRFAHNDCAALENLLRDHAGKTCWVVTESVTSMDGDIAPLKEMLTLCERYGAWLVVDEAHATGVFGEQGKGLMHSMASPRLIVTHTCGKALGVAGALVCASRLVIDTLVNRARAFIYSTAPMPLQAVLVQKALELCAGAEKERERLFQLCEQARREWPVAPSPTPIIPHIVGEDGQAMQAAARLQAKGFDVRAIRPPTVPAGTARLRITLNATLSDAEMNAMGQALREITA